MLHMEASVRRCCDGLADRCMQGGNATGGALFALDVLSGTATPLLDNSQGLKFNSPNDVAVSRDGSVFFTDPSCGQQQGFRDPEQLGEYVWRWDLHSGAASVAAAGFTIVSTAACFFPVSLDCPLHCKASRSLPWPAGELFSQHACACMLLMRREEPGHWLCRERERARTCRGWELLPAWLGPGLPSVHAGA